MSCSPGLAITHSVWDRPDTLVRPDGVSEEVLRDGGGQPREVRIDGEVIAKSRFDGEQLSQIDYVDGEHLTFAYDAQGRITEASTGDLNVLRSYDDEGRLVREQIGDQVVEASYAFDGQLQTITTDRGCARFEYDGDRRLALVEDWQGGQQRYAYDRADRGVVRELPGLREETWLTPVGLIAQVVTHAASGEVLQMWQQFSRDDNDRVATVKDSHLGQTTYSYDSEGQLLAAIGTDASASFVYDAVGNRIFGDGVAARFNESNQIVSVGAEQLLYDKQGNLASREGPDKAKRYIFSARNLLKTVFRSDGPGVDFRYDAFGRRVAKRVGDVTTRYMWWGNHLIYEWVDGDPAARCDYLYKPGTHEPLAMRQRGVMYYFHNGHDGAPRRLTDSVGQVVWMADYAAFGPASRRQRISATALRGPVRR